MLLAGTEGRSGGWSGARSAERKPKRRPSGTARSTKCFHFCLPSMNTTKVSIFSGTIFMNITQNSNNNKWNPGHQNKKIWAVYHEIQLWWYFGPIWVFISYWIRLRYNLNLTTIIFFSWTTFSLSRLLGIVQSKLNIAIVKV